MPFPPYVMLYAPRPTNADLGVDGELGKDGSSVGLPIVAGEGSPDALIMVPVGAHPGLSYAEKE